MMVDHLGTVWTVGGPLSWWAHAKSSGRGLIFVYKSLYMAKNPLHM